MDIFVRLKHWQLFLILVVLPIFLPSDNSASLAISFIIWLIIGGVMFGWLYSTGVNLHKKLPQSMSMNLSVFKSMILIPLVYIVAISTYFASSLQAQPNGQVQLSSGFFRLIFTIHLLAMFCILYCFYFNAKSLKAVEWQKPVTFSDYAGEFFLIWFFPIGIWFIQPRINKLFDRSLQPVEVKP